MLQNLHREAAFHTLSAGLTPQETHSKVCDKLGRAYDSYGRRLQRLVK